ncbi:MAG: DUF4062 domain-containing protein, partial [Acidobacteria bacterium]|nr:DUF4062 domain-containing protein [Acidobacteriota bacterium]
MKSLNDRAVRVFVSSTFRDMASERDELVKQVFPRLRRLCEQWDIVWSDVELRWGIGEEQLAEGNLLPLCLSQIERCRFFVGLLGDRYGTIADEIPAETLALYPWLVDYPGASVTEVEMRYGALRTPRIAEHVFFYLRNPKYVDGLPAEQQPAFYETPAQEEIQRLGRAEAERRARERTRRLDRLKQDVRTSCLTSWRFYRDPGELGGLVYGDLAAAIHKLFPDPEDPDSREARTHNAWASACAEVFEPHSGLIERLEDHANGAGPPLVLVGEPDSGKSTLLGAWATQHRADRPDDLVLVHFAGHSPLSLTWWTLLRSLILQLQAHFHMPQRVPAQEDHLPAAFAGCLGLIRDEDRAVIVIDGLDHISEPLGGRTYNFWLPREVPPNVRLVVSASPSPALDELLDRGWPTLVVDLPSVEARRRILARHLTPYGKQLPPSVTDKVVNSAAAKNPEFLTILAEELRIVATHENLVHLADHYLESGTLVDLFSRILARWEQDYDLPGRPGLVRNAMSLLWVSRFGLTDSELLDMLGSGEGPLPGRYWSPLRNGAGSVLLDIDGIIGFGSVHLRAAVKQRYLATPAAQRAVRRKLCLYLGKFLGMRSQALELPWQLLLMEEWEWLVDILTQLPILAVAWFARPHDVLHYWRRLERHSRYRIERAYIDALAVCQNAIEPDQPLIDPDLYPKHGLQALGALFARTGHPVAAATIHSALARLAEVVGDEAGLVHALGELASDMFEQGDFSMCIEISRRQADLAYATCHRESEAQAHGNLGNAFMHQNRLDLALHHYLKQEELSRVIPDSNGVQASLGNQGNVHARSGDVPGALRLYKQQFEVLQTMGDLAKLSLCRDNIAASEAHLGQHSGAIDKLGKSADLYRSFGMVHELFTNQLMLAEIYVVSGDMFGAR